MIVIKAERAVPKATPKISKPKYLTKYILRKICKIEKIVMIKLDILVL